MTAGDALPLPGGRVLALRTVATALGVGAVAGMATFLYIRDTLVSPWFAHEWGLALIAIAGGFVHVFAADLEDSVAAAILGGIVGLLVYLGAYVSPLYVLEDPPTGAEFFWYDPAVQDALLANLVGRAASTAILSYFLAYLSGYLLVVSLSGYLLE